MCSMAHVALPVFCTSILMFTWDNVDLQHTSALSSHCQSMGWGYALMRINKQKILKGPNNTLSWLSCSGKCNTRGVFLVTSSRGITADTAF